jgi:hypothetical protein
MVLDVNVVLEQRGEGGGVLPHDGGFLRASLRIPVERPRDGGDEPAALVVLVAEGLDLAVDGAVLLLRQLPEHYELFLLVVETVGKSPDELNAVVEEGARRRVLDLESCDRHRKEVDKPPDQTVFVSQRLDWIHVEPPAGGDVLTKNLRPVLTCVNLHEKDVVRRIGRVRQVAPPSALSESSSPR